MALYQQINQRLLSFQSHSLTDLSKALLMERVDTKYLLPITELDPLLVDISAHCTVLSIDERRISHYKNSYFDSQDLRYYLDHHNGALNRYKVRCRTYVEQDKSFLEVKLKNNKKRTIKTRIAVQQAGVNVLKQQQQFLKQNGISEVEQSIEVQECHYQRIAFANEQSGERLTLDFDLSFIDPEHGQQVKIEDFVIIELKQNVFNRHSNLFKLLRKRHLRACNFSKYCIGLSLLRKNKIKQNRFKEIFLRMKKITKKVKNQQLMGSV